MTTHHIFPIILAGLLAFFALPLQAQPTPAQLERVATLVEQGKTEAAKATVETLLEIHPGDPQLTKIQKLLANAPQAAVQPATTTAAGQSGGAGSAAGDSAQRAAQVQPKALSQADQLEISTVVFGIRQAFSEQNTEARKKQLNALLDRKMPEQTSDSTEWLPYWQAIGTAALETDNYRSGWRAGKELIALGALSSQDNVLRQLVANLNMRGWIVESPDLLEAEANEKYKNWLGSWSGQATKNENGGDRRANGGALDMYAWVASLKIDIRLGSNLTPEVKIDSAANYKFDRFGAQYRYHYIWNTAFRCLVPGTWEQKQTTHGGAQGANTQVTGICEFTQVEFDNDMKSLMIHFVRNNSTGEPVAKELWTLRMTEGQKQLSLMGYSPPLGGGVIITRLAKQNP